MNNINKKLLNKALFNINLLIKFNKNERYLETIKNSIKNNPNLNNSELFYINKNIDKIYISHSIKEAVSILNSLNINTNNYNNKYIQNYNNNDKLLLLFKEIENNIKIIMPNRKTFNILPFYYTIYLNKKK
jgi:hypothetical protein